MRSNIIQNQKWFFLASSFWGYAVITHKQQFHSHMLIGVLQAEQMCSLGDYPSLLKSSQALIYVQFSQGLCHVPPHHVEPHFGHEQADNNKSVDDLQSNILLKRARYCNHVIFILKLCVIASKSQEQTKSVDRNGKLQCCDSDFIPLLQ